MKWFFYVESGVVHLTARLEADGLLGDAREEVNAGGTFCGISYETLRDAGSGVIEVDAQGRGKLVP